eukprot:9882257-Alexandrium_andersonii.AAC.1
MSASLVGSEMCIRDSPWLARIACVAWRGAPLARIDKHATHKARRQTLVPTAKACAPHRL